MKNIKLDVWLMHKSSTESGGEAELGSAETEPGPSCFFARRCGSQRVSWKQRPPGHGVSESLFIRLVVDFICSLYLGFSNVRFENKDHLREKKRAP